MIDLPNAFSSDLFTRFFKAPIPIKQFYRALESHSLASSFISGTEIPSGHSSSKHLRRAQNLKNLG